VREFGGRTSYKELNMKRVIVAGSLALFTAGTVISASQPAAGQTNPAPISKASDWNKLMPNPMETPAPTISLPASKLLKPPVAPQTISERVNKNVHDALGYAKTDDWDRALESIDKAVALDPSIDFLYSFRARVFKNLGRNNESVKDMMKFKELQEKNNSETIDRYHKQQVQQAGQPDLRDRVRSFLGN
jgi:tetratricopeptide (TPR) repeat protein